jgi:hypothetical protein
MGPYGKIVGIEATSPTDFRAGFIYCRPSGMVYGPRISTQAIPLHQYPWRTYADTEAFIRQWAKVNGTGNNNSLSNKAVKHRHLAQNGVVIGFLTPSGQTIPVMPPVPLSSADTLHYETVEDESSVESDLAMAPTSMAVNSMAINSMPAINGDTDRVHKVQHIYDENDHYGRFRNLVRTEMQRNQELRQQLMEACTDTHGLELDRLVAVTNLLHELMYGKVTFTDATIATDKTGKESIQEQQKQKQQQKRQFPKTNLHNGMDNEQGYFRRMADELIRYQRINRFIFDNNTLLAMDQTVAPLHTDEMRISAKEMEKFKWTHEDQQVNNSAIYTTANTVSATYTQELKQLLSRH